jgi:lipocalin
MEQVNASAAAPAQPAHARAHAVKAPQHHTAPRPATRIIILREHAEQPRYYGDEDRPHHAQPHQPVRQQAYPRHTVAAAAGSHHPAFHPPKQRIVPAQHHGAVYTGASSAGAHHHHSLLQHPHQQKQMQHHRRSNSPSESESEEDGSDVSDAGSSSSEEEDSESDERGDNEARYRDRRHHHPQEPHHHQQQHVREHSRERAHEHEHSTNKHHHAAPHLLPPHNASSKRARLRSWLQRRAKNKSERISSVAREKADVVASGSGPAVNATAPAMMPMSIMQPMMFPMAMSAPTASTGRFREETDTGASNKEPRTFDDEPFYFELEKFCGMPWYDVAHIRPKWDRWFHSRQSMKDVTSFYTLLPHNKDANHKPPHKFQVHNSAMRGKHLAAISGIATIDTEYKPSTLGDPLVKANVEFPAVARTLFPSAAEISGDFWIYHAEPGAYQQDPYKWTIVANGEKRFCWLKARTPELGPGDMAKARSIVSSMGIAPERLELVQHQTEGDEADSD